MRENKISFLNPKQHITCCFYTKFNMLIKKITFQDPFSWDWRDICVLKNQNAERRRDDVFSSLLQRFFLYSPWSTRREGFLRNNVNIVKLGFFWHFNLPFTSCFFQYFVNQCAIILIHKPLATACKQKISAAPHLRPPHLTLLE